MGSGRLGIDDVLRIARIHTVNLSIEGSVAYGLTVSDLEANKNRSEIRVRRPDGREAYLQGEGDSSPKWSPQGDRLAFISSREGGKQKGSGVYVYGFDGEPRRVAWFKHGVSSLEWLDEGRLAVIAYEEVKGEYDEDYVATDRLPLWYDGSGIVAGLRGQVYLVDADSGSTSKLTSEEHGVIALGVCGGRIYYATPRTWRDPLDMLVKSVDAEGAARVEAEGFTVGAIGCVEGKPVMTAHRRPRGLASHYRLYRLGPRGAECLTCQALDRNVSGLAGEVEGGAVIVYKDSGRSVIARVPIEGGGIEDLVRRDMFVVDAHAAGGRVAFIASTPTEPPEVYLLDGGRVERVSRVNEWLPRKATLSKPVRVEVEAGGDRVEGWVLLPPGAEEGRRYPLILFIHGGPKAMYGYAFYPEMQLFASEGFIVAYANPRGSDGYSEEFADIRGRYGEDDYRQLMEFLDKVVKEFPVDASRMAVTGISYGGYMTNVVVTKTNRFKAAVSENGIADWIADYWASDIGYWFDPDQIGGTPLDNLEEYVKRSPAFNVDKVETPLLIIHSMEDYRCFIDQALAMHVALLSRGKESRLVVFRKGSHGHSVQAPPRHRRKRLELKLKWIKEKLGLA
ncbi:MAG: S9 family peptidase [Desulfurococcales archaeon]|nr:S9 family peptidase [Desulfurococcales archaeon]